MRTDAFKRSISGVGGLRGLASKVGDERSILKVSGTDGRLVSMEEDMFAADGATVAVGDTIFKQGSKDPVGVVLFQACGLFFGAALGQGNQIRKGDVLATRKGYKCALNKLSLDYSKPSIDSSVELCLFDEPFDENQHIKVFRDQPRDTEREVIVDGWTTGVAAVDVLTPLGRGQSMLMTSGKTAERAQCRDKLMLDIAAGMHLLNDKNQGLHTWIAAPLSEAPSSSPLFSDPELKISRDVSSCTLVKATPWEDSSLAGVLNNYIACTLAEVHRDAGSDAALLLPDLHSHYYVWRRAQRLAVDFHKETRGIVPSTIFSPGADRAELRQYYSALIQRSAKLDIKMGGGSMTTLQGIFTGNGGDLMELLRDTSPLHDLESNGPEASQALNSEPTTEHVFTLRDFVEDPERSQKDIQRIRVLASRGIPLSAETLTKIGIATPKVSKESGVDTEEELVSPGNLEEWGLTGPLVTPGTMTQHAEELKSISDGHISAMGPDALFNFDITNSLTRIGIGSNKNEIGDTRAMALRHVAGPLRLQLCNMLDLLGDEPLPELVMVYANWLNHWTIQSSLTVEQQVALVRAIKIGILSPQVDAKFLTRVKRSMPRTLSNVIQAGERRLSPEELDQLDAVLNEAK